MAIGALRVCLDCGAVYTPNVLPGGRMPRDYKQCPQCGSTNTALPAELRSRSKKKLRKRDGGAADPAGLKKSCPKAKYRTNAWALTTRRGGEVAHTRQMD